jgi:isocitrate dehydrogenase
MTQPLSSTRIPATLIPGDGIGEEIVHATLAALDALDAPFDWDRQIAGLAGVQAAGDPLPQATLDSIRRTRLALKGPLETPSGGGYRSSNVRLREEFQLYANLRPARTIIPGGRFDKVDLVVVRENLEGLYIGHEHYVKIDDDPHAVAMATGINTRAGSRRLLEYAFEHAVVTGRRKVTIVHKANIMKALTGIFLETGLDLLLARRGRDPHALVQILREAQALHGWLPRDMLAHSPTARADAGARRRRRGFYRFFHIARSAATGCCSATTSPTACWAARRCWRPVPAPRRGAAARCATAGQRGIDLPRAPACATRGRRCWSTTTRS